MSESTATEPRRVVVSGSITQTIEVEAESIAEGVRAWQEKAGSGYPDGWEEANDPDGAFGDIHGGCESCELPILEGEPFVTDDDGIMWHVRCDDSEHATDSSSDPEGTTETHISECRCGRPGREAKDPRAATCPVCVARAGYPKRATDV